MFVYLSGDFMPSSEAILKPGICYHEIASFALLNQHIFLFFLFFQVTSACDIFVFVDYLCTALIFYKHILFLAYAAFNSL